MFNVPIALDDLCCPLSVLRYECLSGAEDLTNFHVVGNVGSRSSRLWSRGGVSIEFAKILQVTLHSLWLHEREPCVDTVCTEIIGQRAEEETTESRTEPIALSVSLAVSETPGSQVVGREVLCVEPVTTSQGESI